MGARETTTNPVTLTSSVRIPSHVVYRTFALETVIVNLESGMYHGLNRTAGRMLEALHRDPVVGDAAAKLAADFQRPLEQIQADLCAFLTDLLERGLVELR
jgi:hypothetical protein